MAAAGLLLLVVNHWHVVDQQEAFLWAVLLGPPALILGLAGIAEPRVLLAAGKYGRALPAKFKAMAFAALVVGFAVAAMLIFLVYQLG
jgi:hypothetical protein